MLAIISPLIQRGVIDNTLEGLIDLRLWCVDGKEPFHCRMRGNCLQDIAGCRVEFENHNATTSTPQERELSVLQALRDSSGDAIAGDITLSLRSPGHNNRRELNNSLAIEFFLGCNVRILIVSSAFTFTLSLPQWHMSWEQDNAQRLLNMDALRNHVAYNIERYRGPGLTSASPQFPLCDWDYRLNRAEACMAIYPSVRDKYAGEPGGAACVAYVMDRPNRLGELAAEEESRTAPAPETPVADFEVLDFMPAEHVPLLRRAMHHELFLKASRMTATVQRHLMRDPASPSSVVKHAGAYVTSYAGIISHILATILLTQQDTFNHDIAATRIRVLEMRVADLADLGKDLPEDARTELDTAAQTLIAGLGEMLGGLRRS